MPAPPAKAPGSHHVTSKLVLTVLAKVQIEGSLLMDIAGIVKHTAFSVTA